MEEKYWRLREDMERAYDKYCRFPETFYREEYEYRKSEFQSFCTEILEKLMDKNSDILANLKSI